MMLDMMKTFGYENSFNMIEALEDGESESVEST